MVSEVRSPRSLLDGGPYKQPNLGIVPSTLNPLYVNMPVPDKPCSADDVLTCADLLALKGLVGEVWLRWLVVEGGSNVEHPATQVLPKAQMVLPC